jgi:hypothetical protein
MKQVYTSRYTDRKITAAQRIAEIVCEKLADKEKKVLTDKFWNKPEWEKVYKQQLYLANSLLKLYSAEAIIAALRDKRAYDVYSLGADFVLDKIFQEEQAKIDNREANMIAPPEQELVKELPRQPVKKKSIYSKLMRLDDDGNSIR